MTQVPIPQIRNQVPSNGAPIPYIRNQVPTIIPSATYTQQPLQPIQNNLINDLRQRCETYERRCIDYDSRIEDLSDKLLVLIENAIEKDRTITMMIQDLSSHRDAIVSLQQLLTISADVSTSTEAIPSNEIVTSKNVDEIPTYGSAVLHREDLIGLSLSDIDIYINRLRKNIATYKVKGVNSNDIPIMDQNLALARSYRLEIKPK